MLTAYIPQCVFLTLSCLSHSLGQFVCCCCPSSVAHFYLKLVRLHLECLVQLSCMQHWHNRINASSAPVLHALLAHRSPSATCSSCFACLQVTDGAAAVLMMTRREALQRQLPILGIFRSFAAVGVDPAIMGVGPAVAIPEAVKQAGLTIDDIDLFELNEAFASQVCQP